MALMSVGVAAWAQTPDVDKVEANLKKHSASIKRISDQLDAGNVPEATLNDMLQTLLGYNDDIQSDADDLRTALDEPRKRLSDLGPPPAEDQPPESADIAKLRKSLTDQITRATGLAQQADLSLADIDRLVGKVRGLQGARSRSTYTTRGMSPWSSKMWTTAAAQIRPAVEHITDHIATWWRDQRTDGKWVADVTLVLAALAAAIGLWLLPRWSLWRNAAAAFDDKTAPTALDKRRRVAARALSRGLLAAVAGALLYVVAVEIGLVSQAGKYVALRMWAGATFLVLNWTFAQGLFSPRRPEWRVVSVSSQAARTLQILFVAILGPFVIDRILVKGLELTDAGIELTLAQATVANILFCTLLWFFLGRKLWHSATPSPPAIDAADDTKQTSQVSHDWPYEVLRVAGRVLAVLILLATALAYIKLANFLYHRVVLLALFLILLWCTRVVARWGLHRLPIGKPPADGAPQDDDRSEKESLGFWLELGVDLNLLALSVPAFLLIVGFDWLDVRRWLAVLRSDVRIGAISFSFTDILSALVVFLLVSMGTRWATGIVDKKLLQRTGLDAGERNSITTLVNYVGVAVATLFALAIVGVGVSKLAIVAGALSVGIGFGLQSIVNNFVSGLILLFERPIKIGDWVMVSSGEGYVKHIGARATEIQTFDRASVIVPNSELVTSAVQNWFYKSRIGRLRVNVGVSYGSDPEQVRDILLDCAKKHPSISSYPATSVRWTDFGESSLDFQLRAYVGNVDDSYEVRSDLRFAIFKAFKEAGVEIPFPQRDLHIRADGTPTGGSAVKNLDIERDKDG